MLKMMTYYEANQLPLNHTLSPNQRCIWKKQALDEGADPTPMNVSPYNTSEWTDNRLIPATIVRKNDIVITWNAVEPGTTGGSFAGGATTTTTTVAYGASIQANKPANPTKTGYTFYRWVNDTTHNVLGNETASSPTSYSATYTINTYTIVWWANANYTGTPHSTVTPANYDTYITKPITNPQAPTTGYHFDHWVNRATGDPWSSNDKVSDSLVYTTSGNIEYYPVFVQDTQYTMTWNPNGGTWADSTGTGNKTTYEYAGNTITIPNVNITKDGGWAFDGWYNSTLNRDYQVGDTAGGNYTFTAKWTPVVQLLATVSWQTDNDGGSGSSSLVHGDPNNNIENGDTAYNWLSGSTPVVPINTRFEPLFTLNGQEIGPTSDSFTTSLYASRGISMPYQLNEADTIIGYYGGTGFKVGDLTWDATTTGTGYVTDSLYNNNQPYTYDIDLIFRNVNGGGPTNGNVSVTACNMNTNSDGPQSGYGMAITIHTDSSDPNGNNVYMYWMDEIPVTYVAKYQGNVVTTMTIKMAAYSWAALRDTYGPDASEPNPGTHPRIDGPWKVNA